MRNCIERGRRVVGVALATILAGPACELSTSGLSLVSAGVDGSDRSGESRPSRDGAVARPDSRAGSGTTDAAAGKSPEAALPGSIPPVVSDGGVDPSAGDSPDAGAVAVDAGLVDSAGTVDPPDAGQPPPPDAGQPPPPDAGTACPVGEPGLALCLAFEGRVADQSPAAHPVGVRQVGFAPGLEGSAAELGEQSAISIAQGLSLFAGPPLTLEAWIQPGRLPGPGQRAGIIDRDGHFGLFVMPGGALTCLTSGATVTVAAAVGVGRWTSVACTISPASVDLWIDGTIRATSSVGLRIPGLPLATLSVGSNNPAGDNLVGWLDNVRIWTRVRAPEEICRAAHACVD